MNKYIKLFEEHEEDEEDLRQLRDLGLADPELTYDLTFSIDMDWAMGNGPTETVTEITNLINGVGDWKGVGKVSVIEVSGTFGSKGIDWEGPLSEVGLSDEAGDYDADEIDIYEFTSDAFITFTSFLGEEEIEDFINDQLVHITAYGTYDLELIDN
jgi:hypothetical protein